MKIEGKPFSAFDAAKLPGGLVPAVIQDDRTLQVLMLGYMNREAYEKSLAEGRVTFYSRSRQRLWTKGETSGNWLDIVSVAADCDCDTLLIPVGGFYTIDAATAQEVAESLRARVIVPMHYRTKWNADWPIAPLEDFTRLYQKVPPAMPLLRVTAEDLPCQPHIAVLEAQV